MTALERQLRRKCRSLTFGLDDFDRDGEGRAFYAAGYRAGDSDVLSEHSKPKGGTYCGLREADGGKGVACARSFRTPEATEDSTARSESARSSQRDGF